MAAYGHVHSNMMVRERWGVRVYVKGATPRRTACQPLPAAPKSTTWAQGAGQTTRAFLSYVSERPKADSRVTPAPSLGLQEADGR
jgi:hypothetical protein